MIKKYLIITCTLLILFSCAVSNLYSDLMHSNLNLIASITEWDAKRLFFSKTPDIFLYEDGTLLFTIWSESETGIEYKCKQIKITNTVFNKLLKTLGPTNDFIALNEDYYLVDAGITAPTFTIYLSDLKHAKAVTLHGVVGIYENNKQYVKSAQKASTQEIPNEFNRVYELLRSIPLDGATEYKPKYLRVFLQLLEDSKVDTIPWPKDLPDLNDRYTLSFYKDTVYYIFIPVTKSEKLERYLSKLRSKKKAILLDGKKWSILYYPVLPHQHIGGVSLKETKD